MLLYRIAQAHDLLDLPDFGGGDFDSQQRRDALKRHVVFKQPLTALSLFLGVVAVEDYLRDFGARLSANKDFVRSAPGLISLEQQRSSRKQLRMFDRLDRDAFNPVDPDAVNRAFHAALGIDVIDVREHNRLRDLALVRHTVAHHASVFRTVDAPRFQYYKVTPGAPINPPPEFVKNTVQYLWQVARGVEIRVRNELLGRFKLGWPSDWRVAPNVELLRFIEFFEDFGFVETSRISVNVLPEDEPARSKVLAERTRIQNSLLESCLNEIETPTSMSVPPV